MILSPSPCILSPFGERGGVRGDLVFPEFFSEVGRKVAIVVKQERLIIGHLYFVRALSFWPVINRFRFRRSSRNILQAGGDHHHL